MKSYTVRYIHKITPSPNDVLLGIVIPDGAFSNRNTLGKALREAKVLCRGDSVSEFRVEGDKVVAFPRASIWHSVILTAE